MEIGYNKLDITPDYPVRMAGYNRKEKSIGCLDPIEIHSLFIKNNDDYVVISLLDSIIIEDSVIQPVKEILEKKYRFKKENIIIGCIHTHSAPAYFKPFFEDVQVEEELQQLLIKQFCTSIMNAHLSLKKRDISISQTTIDGLYGNRNNKDGYSDKDITVLAFKDHEKIFYSLLFIATHPTILDGSNLYLSADLIGYIRKKYVETFHHPCMIANGCCGDISTRFYRESNGKDELERVSSEIVRQLTYSHKLNYSIHTLKTSTVVEEYTYHGNDAFITRELRHLKNKDDPISLMLYNTLKIKKEKSPMTLKLTSHIIILGDVIIITLPGDITSSLGKMIKDAFPDYLVLTIGYCENYSNYFVCEEEYGKYFESYISRLEKGNADQYVNRIINETKRLL